MRLIAFLALLLWHSAIATAPNMPRLSPNECRYVAQYLFWIADYRDVKADKEILKSRMKHSREDLLAFMRAEIDRVYATPAEDGETTANNFMVRCLAPEMKS